MNTIYNYNQYELNGFDIREIYNADKGTKTVDVRRHYSASVHKGFPADWKRIVEDIPATQTKERIEEYVSKNN